MSDSKPLMRPSDLRRAVAEWVALGCSVEIMPDGKIRVSPAGHPDSRDAFDLVDMKK
ncbi:hypothetical protein [Thioclava sp. IC9]|uniref:hypothetical protein n=1 Tax=Thioclava sp. IC9 TaxID=1973007 RepID=UPI001411E3E5|nr:hypothetical protein [Thioclava sp. IC9]